MAHSNSHKLFKIAVRAILYVYRFRSPSKLVGNHIFPAIGKMVHRIYIRVDLGLSPILCMVRMDIVRFAQFADAQMLDVSNLQYKSFETLLFQRVSVIISDIVLAFGVKICADAFNETNRRSQGNQKSVKRICDINQTNYSIFQILNGT